MAERTGSSKRKGRFGSNLEGNSEVLRSWGWVYEVYEFMKRLPKQTSISTLDQCFSNCGPWTNSISITWDLVRNTNSMAELKTNWVRTSTVSLPILCLQSSAGDSDALLSWDQNAKLWVIFFNFQGLFFFYSQGHEQRNSRESPGILFKFHFLKISHKHIQYATLIGSCFVCF